MAPPRKPWLSRLINDCLTGPDGVTFAFGRVAAAVLLAGHPAAVSIYGVGVFVAHAPTWTEAAGFVAAVAATYAIVVEAAQRLVRLTNFSEPTS